jgi:hypothetical protein
MTACLGPMRHALVNSRWFNTRHETRYVIDPSPRDGRVLLERNYQDRYNDPGDPMTEPNAAGLRCCASPPTAGRADDRPGRDAASGEYPFLAAMNLTTGRSSGLWTGQRRLRDRRRPGSIRPVAAS